MKNKEQTKNIILYILLIIGLLAVIQVAQFFVSSNVKAKLPISST